MPMRKTTNNLSSSEYSELFFETPAQWRAWLEQYHSIEKGVWLRFYKKGSGIVSLNYAGALDEALCYGWIDGQAKTFDEKSYLQKFTPRRARSIWSKKNIEHITRLIQEGKMKPSGLKEAEAAKTDGRWQQAYDSPANMTVPEDFIRELSKDKKAFAFFETLNKANTYAIAWRLQTAKKPETREKRIKIILDMMSRGEKFH
jgi:uncharacterized protein YdeI (YjbR/CyaY-like superfamily)